MTTGGKSGWNGIRKPLKKAMQKPSCALLRNTGCTSMTWNRPESGMRKLPARATLGPVKSWVTFGKTDTWARKILPRPWSGTAEPGYEVAPALAMPLPECMKKAEVFPNLGNRQHYGIKSIGADRKFTDCDAVGETFPGRPAGLFCTLHSSLLTCFLAVLSPLFCYNNRENFTLRYNKT